MPNGMPSATGTRTSRKNAARSAGLSSVARTSSVRPRTVIDARPAARRFWTQWTSPHGDQTQRRPSRSMIARGVERGSPLVRPRMVIRALGPMGTPARRRRRAIGLKTVTQRWGAAAVLDPGGHGETPSYVVHKGDPHRDFNVTAARGTSAGDHRQVELAEPVGVGQDVDRDDPPALDGQGQDGERTTVRIPRHTSWDAIHQDACRRSGERTEGQRLLGDGGRPADQRVQPGRAIPPSERSTTSGSRTARRRSKSPYAPPPGTHPRQPIGRRDRHRARARPGRGGGHGSRVASPPPVCGRRSARSRRTAPRRHRAARTRPVRAGVRASRTTSIASPTESPSSASCSGSTPSSGLRMGSGRWVSRDASRRVVAMQHVEADPPDDRRQPRPQVFDLARVGAAQADPGSWTASSASVTSRASGRRPRAGGRGPPRSVRRARSCRS